MSVKCKSPFYFRIFTLGSYIFKVFSKKYFRIVCPNIFFSVSPKIYSFYFLIFFTIIVIRVSFSYDFYTDILYLNIFLQINLLWLFLACIYFVCNFVFNKLYNFRFSLTNKFKNSNVHFQNLGNLDDTQVKFKIWWCILLNMTTTNGRRWTWGRNKNGGEEGIKFNWFPLMNLSTDAY